MKKSATLLLFLCFFIAKSHTKESFGVTNYYWRDYDGSIPLDAFHANSKRCEKPIYVGLGYFNGLGIIAGTLRPGVTEMTITGYNRLYTTNKHIKNRLKKFRYEKKFNGIDAGNDVLNGGIEDKRKHGPQDKWFSTYSNFSMAIHNYGLSKLLASDTAELYGADPYLINRNQILCGPHPELLQWIQTSSITIAELAKRCHLVSGGSEEGKDILIGKTIFKDKSEVAKVFPYPPPILVVPVNDSASKEVRFEEFEVLAYNCASREKC